MDVKHKRSWKARGAAAATKNHDAELDSEGKDEKGRKLRATSCCQLAIKKIDAP